VRSAISHLKVLVHAVIATLLLSTAGRFPEAFAQTRSINSHQKISTRLAVLGFPTAGTTGVPDGATLTQYPGPMKITTPGTVIDGKIISGDLVIAADTVTVKNSKLMTGGYWGIDAEYARNVTIQDCDIIGNGTVGNSGILGAGNFMRNDISGFGNGITATGGALIKGNYIHDLQVSGPDPHYDGIQIMGPARGLRIEDNTILSRDTSDLFITSEFGPIDNVVINHNYLGGDVGYSIYLHNVTNATISNNAVEKGGWGYYDIVGQQPAMSGNIEYGGVPLK
jgi:Right handed beta helix region